MEKYTDQFFGSSNQIGMAGRRTKMPQIRGVLCTEFFGSIKLQTGF
jgi:hypothetical protein